MRNFAQETYMEDIGECVDAEWLNNFLDAAKPLGVWLAAQLLNNQLVADVDYIRKRVPTKKGGSKVVWMLSMHAASMIAMSDRGSKGWAVRRAYALQVAELESSMVDTATLKKMEGARGREQIHAIGGPREKREPERYPPIVIDGSKELPDESITIQSFVSEYGAIGHKSIHSAVQKLFHFGFVDHLGWPEDGIEWLQVKDGVLYINPAQAAGVVKMIKA